MQVLPLFSLLTSASRAITRVFRVDWEHFSTPITPIHGCNFKSRHNVLFQCFAYLPTTIIRKKLEINLVCPGIWGYSSILYTGPLSEPRPPLVHSSPVLLLRNPCSRLLTTLTDENIFHLSTVFFFCFFLILGQVQSNPDEPGSLNWEIEVRAALRSDKPAGKIDPERLKLPQRS